MTSGAALAIIAVNAVVGQLVLAEALLVACVAVVVVSTARSARAGRGPAGAGYALPAGLAVWAVGHVLEAITVARHPQPQTAGWSDVAFMVVVAVLVVAAGPVLLRSATYVDRTAVLRTTLDSVLIAVGVGTVYWQWVLVPYGDVADPGETFGMALATTYTVFCSLMAAAVVTRAWQRRDAGSWGLAVGATTCVLGVIAWSTAKFGPDYRLFGVTLMAVGVILLPFSVNHPGHERPVLVRRGDERDRLGALGFHLASWAATVLALEHTTISPGLASMAVMSLFLIFGRVFVVRHSERRLVERLRAMAFTDPLTGIGNRRSLMAGLASGGDAWLVTLDLDGFKQVNDGMGHDAGDELLGTIASQLTRLAGRHAHVARIGGDEFAVLLPGPREAAWEFAEHAVRHAYDDRYAWITASAGIAEHHAGDDPAASLRSADIALQEAKRSGKSRAVELTTPLLSQRLRELEIADRLRGSMDEIRLVYQPIVALAPGNPIVAVEALARWHDDVLGPVPPAEFVPICERNGLIGALGDIVLSQALAQLRIWHDEGTPRQVTVNVSWLQLRDEITVTSMIAHLRRNSDLVPWLVLEVTESVFAEDPDALVAVSRMRDLGVAIAVDDFGSGSSTLTRLRDLPADILKLDGSLVDGVGTDPDAESVLALVRWLGVALGVAVIVEGVEDRATAQRVEDIGFEYVQGFFFGRPAPPSLLPAATPHTLPRRSTGRHRASA